MNTFFRAPKTMGSGVSILYKALVKNAHNIKLALSLKNMYRSCHRIAWIDQFIAATQPGPLQTGIASSPQSRHLSKAFHKLFEGLKGCSLKPGSGPGLLGSLRLQCRPWWWVRLWC